MPPKRKDPPSEPSRRSSRSAPSSTAKEAAPSAPPASKSKPKAASKTTTDESAAKDEPAPEKKGKTSHTTTQVGDIVKDVVLKNENNEEVSFASAYEKSGIVLFSYPKANTGGCTTQAKGYRDIYDKFKEAGYEVYGISADSPSSQLVCLYLYPLSFAPSPHSTHQRAYEPKRPDSAFSPLRTQSWKTSRSFQFSFFCDPKRILLSALGSTGDRGTKRCHWVIEKGGKLLEAKVGVQPGDDPANALKFVKSL